jgi:hypothetical protein
MNLFISSGVSSTISSPDDTSRAKLCVRGNGSLKRFREILCSFLRIGKRRKLGVNFSGAGAQLLRGSGRGEGAIEGSDDENRNAKHHTFHRENALRISEVRSVSIEINSPNSSSVAFRPRIRRVW